MKPIKFVQLVIFIHALSFATYIIKVDFNDNELKRQLIEKYLDICVNETYELKIIDAVEQLEEVADMLDAKDNNVLYKDFISKYGNIFDNDKIKDIAKEHDLLDTAKSLMSRLSDKRVWRMIKLKDRMKSIEEMRTLISKIDNQHSKEELTDVSKQINLNIEKLDSWENKIVRSIYKDLKNVNIDISNQNNINHEKNKQLINDHLLHLNKLYNEAKNMNTDFQKQLHYYQKQQHIFEEMKDSVGKKYASFTNTVKCPPKKILYPDMPFRKYNINSLTQGFKITIVKEGLIRNTSLPDGTIFINHIMFDHIVRKSSFTQSSNINTSSYLFQLTNTDEQTTFSNVPQENYEINNETEIKDIGDIVTDLSTKDITYTTKILIKGSSKTIVENANNYEWLCDLYFRSIQKVNLECSVTLKKKII